jgi:hypothetical protein
MLKSILKFIPMALHAAVRYLIVMGLVWGIFSCGPCRNADALVSTYEFEFTVVDGETGEDLIFGENARLDPDGFQLYSHGGTERISHGLYPGEGAIWADIRGVRGDLYLEYPDGKIDTLQVFFERRETECWGTVDRLSQLTRNGSEVYADIYQLLLFEY